MTARRAAFFIGVGLVVFVLVAWALGEAWVAAIGTHEADLMRQIAAGRAQPLIDIARVVTWAGSAWLLVPLAIVFCALLYRAGLARQALALALALGGAKLIYFFAKELVARPRPDVEHLQHVTGWSFPSGHATQAGAFWLSLALALRAGGLSVRVRRVVWVVCAVIVLAVAASRVYLGVHYPSDVVAGVALGAAWALYVERCLTRVR